MRIYEASYDVWYLKKTGPADERRKSHIAARSIEEAQQRLERLMNSGNYDIKQYEEVAFSLICESDAEFDRPLPRQCREENS